MRAVILALLSVCLALPAPASATLGITHVQTDSGGVQWYDATSVHNGPGGTILRILSPTNPAPGMSRRFIYVLPVIMDVDVQNAFGDGLEELRALNVHNDYNAHIIAPSFQVTPWYANHAWLAGRQYESFLVQDLVPWVQANLAVTGQEEHWLLGFSKSGFGAVNLLMRNPAVFAAAAAWDLPADQPDASVWDMLDNYGTEANFQANYRLTSDWIAARRDPFLSEPRLWLSDDYVTHFGMETFRDQVLALAERLSANGVRFVMEGGATRIHTWMSGWLPNAVAGLQRMRYGTRDDFNRADGGLGPGWTVDPWWGNGMVLAGNQVTGSPGTGGAHYWTATPSDPDQYAEVTLTGLGSNWIGVAVRASAAPVQGYWVAIKPEGAFLYALVDGTFHLLGQDPGAWSPGDVLRLEVRTIAAGTARLTVYRNSAVLFTHEEAAHFIASGLPGIGMQAAIPLSLDNWSGGALGETSTPPPPPPPPPPPSDAHDDFNRADGGLGPDWTIDPWWGNGMSIDANQVTASPGTGGAYYWTATAVGPDQYSQVSLTGLGVDWIGVAVRASAAPSQGYWVAIKPDGSYLYSLVDGDFHLLVQDATLWVPGDVLRVEARTIAAGTARLTVYRNAAVLYAHDDAAYFIATGQPGIGMHAGSTLSLDDWYGGTLDPAAEPPPPPPAPVDTVISASPANPSNSGDAVFTFSSNVSGGTFQCQIDGGGFTDCTSPRSYSGLVNGSHAFEVRAVDSAGAVDPTPASHLWTVDLTAPTISITSPTTAPAYATAAALLSLAGTADDNSEVTLVTWTNDRGGSGTAAGTATWQVSGIALQNGLNVITVSARDRAGHVGVTRLSVTRDTIRPDTTITAAPSSPSHSNGASFSFASSEAGSTFECRMDGGSYVSCASPASYSNLAAGSHTFRVRAVDAAGNVDGSPASHTWTYSPVTQAPSSIVVDTGTPQGGTAASLSADDNSFYQVNSTTSGTRTTSWYGVFGGVSKSLSNLKVSYKGKNSQSCVQTIAIWRWSDSVWVQLDSRNVGNSEVSIANLVPMGAPGEYVSGSSGSGDLRIQVRCTRTGNFFASGDRLSIVFDTP